MTPAGLRFGDVTVDVGRRELTRRGELQHLEPQAFDLLVALIGARDRVVSKAELLERVWGDQFVSEYALTTRIKEIRRALGDDGTRQAIIRNVRGRGYRFVAPLAEPEEDEPAGGPSWATAAIGRAEDVTAVVDALDRTRVVTIIGPGGIGKTTVARAVAKRAAGSDGVVFARLTPVTDTRDVVFAVGRAAGLRGTVGDDEEVLGSIAPLDVLLVLDNCEHVVAGAAELAKTLLEHDGGARILATSRERLGIAGELVIALDVLSHNAARQLFAERAAAVHTGFRLDEETSPIVDRIVDRLDRLPLAIEMAAARLAAVELTELADLLEHRLDVLRSPDRSADDRHRTLAALVAWSTEQLGPEDRRALQSFAVFAGSVTGADIEGVLGGQDDASSAAEPSVLDGVLGLVDRSLVVADPSQRPTRYRMLSTIRAHVGRAGDDHATQRRHAEWFTELAVENDRRLGTPDERAANDRLDGVLAELRAAHRWARRHDPALAARMTAALDCFAHTRLWSEPALWAADLLASAELDPALLRGVWAALAAQACHRADFVVARDLARRVVGGPDDVRSDPVGVASALESLADIALYEGDLETSLHFGTLLRRHGEEVSDGYALGAGACEQALALAYGGRFDEALDCLDNVPVSDLPPSARAWLDYAAGEARTAVDPRSAIPHFETALVLAAEASNHYIRTVTSTSLLSARSRADDPAAALPAFETILREFRRYGSQPHSATALRNLVDVLARAGHDQPAMVLLGSLVGVAKSTYGAELERLDAARDMVTARVGHVRVAEWVASGEALSDDPTAPMAIALDHLACCADTERRG
jgi:predicted ATPase/DNA-binding winged helix-turn-helix (wHTH) protein